MTLSTADKNVFRVSDQLMITMWLEFACPATRNPIQYNIFYLNTVKVKAYAAHGAEIKGPLMGP